MASAIFKITEGDEGQKVLKMSAIGKYPFLTVSTTSIDFDTILIGKVDSKTITVKNNSLVSGQFTIEKAHDDGKDPSFSLDYYSGDVPPNSLFAITVKYVPSLVGTVSCAKYKLKTVGGNEAEFSVKGYAEGVTTSLSNKSVHFGEVQIGQTTNRLLNIVNDSDLPTQFQFMNDKKNIFSFSKIEGVVNAHSSTRIIINFTPTETVNYYERIFCMVRNH